ncbi:MAG: helix-turn-helix domain-containing protein [Chloroflexota bacterium]|nr:helix-turn-helix domain-containing protein [Chloroflexota bacterium]
MSIRTMDRVWKNSTQAGGKLLLLLAIADFANDDGMAYPGIKTLAEKTRQSRRTVQRQLSMLEKKGEIAIEPGTGRSNTNTFWVLAGMDPELKQTHIEHCQKLKGDKMTPFNPSEKGDIDDIKGGIDDIKRVTSDAENSLKGDSDDIKGDTAMTPEPLLTVIKQNRQFKSNRHEPSMMHKKLIDHFDLKLEWEPRNEKIVAMLKKCRPRADGDGVLILQTPDADEAAWLKSRMTSLLTRMIAGLECSFDEVTFEILEEK